MVYLPIADSFNLLSGLLESETDRDSLIEYRWTRIVDLMSTSDEVHEMDVKHGKRTRHYEDVNIDDEGRYEHIQVIWKENLKTVLLNGERA